MWKSKECGKHVLYPSADSKAESLLLAFPVCPKSKVEPMPQRWALVCRCLLCLFLCVWVWGHTDMLECKTFLGSGDVVLERRYLMLEGKRWVYQTHVAHCLSLLKAMLGYLSWCLYNIPETLINPSMVRVTYVAGFSWWQSELFFLKWLHLSLMM